ncbi:MAG: sugar nucleotide-binding protein, partial [Ignavibacteriaceae bacterium]|nr:sugar nucleotide-binding protein [Ignavibacteriaceae bacterium]
MEGEHFDLLVCAGVRAEKWMANLDPERDKNNISLLERVLEKVTCNRFILISTVDVYGNKVGVDENSVIDPLTTDYYGRHRLEFEEFVARQFNTHTIIRLPGLFGKGLKKNFIFDILNPIPKFLSPALLKSWESRLNEDDLKTIKNIYSPRPDGIYEKQVNTSEDKLSEIFNKINFSSLTFTDSRSSFQFYNLQNIGTDIEMLLAENIRLINLTAAPVSAAEIYSTCFGNEFVNPISNSPIKYDIQT